MGTCRLAFAAAAILLSTPSHAQEPASAPAAPDYAQEANWLCLPGRSDSCGQPLPTTALNANGYGSVGQSDPAKNPPVDCFYVYPTVSRDPGDNSDLKAGPEEQTVARVQFARFASVCRTFAPMYRQATLASLLRAVNGGESAQRLALAYSDVAAAWQHYLARHNQGRPFVLIGHSQGTIHLSQLLAREVEGRPAARRMLSAMLIGFNIEVPEGKRVGGTFRHTPLCRRVGETGCVVTYVSFRASNPPPPNAFFGRAVRPGMTVGCTNPASLVRTTAPLDSYWFAGPAVTSSTTPIQWSSSGPPPTAFLRTKGLVSAACVNKGSLGYLSVTVNALPADARTDQIPGDVTLVGRIAPGWGLHLADMNLAMGDLVALIEAQTSKAR